MHSSFRRDPGAALVVPVLLLLAGCAHVDPEPTFRSLTETVTDRQTPAPEWTRDSNPLLLDAPTRLERDDVVRLALLHNAGLQATFEELGLAVADLVQAGRPRNPSLHVSARSPEDGGSTNLELGLAQNLLQLLTLPAQKRIARAELEETRLRVARAVLELARDAELAYLGLVAAQQQVDLRSTILEAASAGYDLAQRFYDAGNVNELQLRREQSLREAARIELLEASKRQAVARRELRDVLGTWGETEINWSVGSRLPDVPAESLDVALLERQAVEERLDLQAAAQEVRALEMALGLNRRWRLLGGLEIEASAEREVDGEWVIGPGIDLELPLFDQGQPRVARAEAALRRSERLFEARVAAVRSEVLQLHEQLRLEHQLAGRYLRDVIPMNQRTVQLAQEQYNYMLAGIFEVLEAKRHEYDAYADYIDTVRDYWQTRARLRVAVGGRLPEVPFVVDGEPPAAVEASDPHAHHHSGAQR